MSDPSSSKLLRHYTCQADTQYDLWCHLIVLIKVFVESFWLWFIVRNCQCFSIFYSYGLSILETVHASVFSFSVINDITVFFLISPLYMQHPFNTSSLSPLVVNTGLWMSCKGNLTQWLHYEGPDYRSWSFYWSTGDMMLGWWGLLLQPLRGNQGNCILFLHDAFHNDFYLL